MLWHWILAQINDLQRAQPLSNSLKELAYTLFVRDYGASYVIDGLATEPYAQTMYR